jgi:metastasis-associated protein MTA
MDTLHKHTYSIESAMCSLVPSSGPVLCRDEMEEWSASEANLFEEALDKYGKDFNDIRNDFVSEALSTYRRRLYDSLKHPRTA